MKMKIIKHKFFLFTFIILVIFQPVILLSLRSVAENQYRSQSEKDDFYNGSYRAESYETPIMTRNQDQEWNNPQEGNLEVNNLAINNNNNLSDITFHHNTAPLVRLKNNSQIMTRMPNTVMGIGACPCISRVKCTPCGIAPVLDFNRNSRLDCPCAPKPNCPICPPLSLIHEIASRKVKYYFK